MRQTKRYNGGGEGYSKEALDALVQGQYRDYSGNRQSKYHSSEAQLDAVRSLPVLKGMTFLPEASEDWQSKLSRDNQIRRANQYQQNLAEDAKNYQFNDATRKANTLDADDMNFLQKYYDSYGDSARMKQLLYESKKTQGWEQKYGKSLDQIYKDFVADQGNANIEKGMKSPIKSEIETALGIIPQLGVSGASLVGNLINPDSKFAKGAENLRHENEVVRKQKRTGVKDRTAAQIEKTYELMGSPEVLKNAKDKVKSTYVSGLDTLHGLSDRALPAAIGKAITKGTNVPYLDAVLSGLSDYNTQMEEVRNRPDMNGRQQAIAAGTHAAVEGAGTAVTMGLLDKIPGASGLLGKAINVGKGAGNAAAENWISEMIEQKLDNLVSGDLSRQALQKGTYMAKGMSEEQADEQVRKDAQSERINALKTGALFGGVMKGIPEVMNSLPFMKEAPVVDEIAEQPEVEQPAGNKIPVTTNNVEVPDFAKLKADWEAQRAVNKANSIPVNNGSVEVPDFAKLKADWEAGRAANKAPEAPVETGNVEVPKPVSEPVDWTEKSPRYTKALEGEELNNAKAQKKANQTKINAYKNEIDLLKKDPKSLYRGKLKKAIQNEIKAKEAEIRKLQSANKDIDQNVKGGLKPVLSMLTKEQKNRIYDTSGKTDSVFSMINFAVKFAGDTPEAKALSEQAKNAIREYVNTGSSESAKAMVSSLTELDNMAKATNAEWTSSKGNKWTYEQRFGDQAMYLSDLQPVYDIYRAEKALRESAGNTQSAPEAARRISDEEIFENDRKLAAAEDEEYMRQNHIEPSIEASRENVEAPYDPALDPEMRENYLDPMKEEWNRDAQDDWGMVYDEEAPKTAASGGDVPPNEPPKPPVPPETPPENPETDISRRYETLRNSDLFTKSEANMKMLDTAKEEGVFNKDVESRKKAQAEAIKEYLDNPEEVTQKNFDKQWDSGKDVDTAMLVLNDALDSGSQAYTNLALLKQAIQGKKAGRILRAMRDYAYNGTREGMLSKAGDYLVDKAEKVLKNKKTNADYSAMAESIKKGDMSVLDKLDMDETNISRIRDAVQNGASVEDIKTMLAIYKAVGTTGISQETLSKVNELQAEMEKVPPTSKARAELEDDVFKVIAQDIGGKRTPLEMWDAWRYLAMLGNPKTHLRNVLGNTMHRMVTNTKDNVGAVIEEAVDKINRKTGGNGIERTKALLNANDKGLIDIARKDADDVAYASLNDMGNKYNVKTEIERARDAFNNKKLSKLEEFNSHMLDLEDYSALKSKYSTALARFLKANGADERIFSATDDASKALLDKGRAYAIDQAKQATFHEYSKMAEALTQFSQKLQKSDRLRDKVGGYALEGLVPFKKTPINILKQGFKYSPVELVKSIGKIYDAAKNGGSVSDAIESLSAGLTGTGIYALGAFLASQGVLSGSAEDDYTVDNAQTEQGEQNYAIKIGDNSYTLDWLAPFALPLFAGVETYKLMNREHGDNALDAFVDGLTAIAEPVTEMSMLQGINDTLNSLSYNGVKSAIGTFAGSALTGYATQGVPTLAGQIARTFDNTRRSTYSDQDSALRRQLDKALTKVQNKLPFLSMDNQPYVDSRGQVQQSEGVFSHYLGDNIGTRLADQMLSPGYFKSGTITDVDRELNRLYQETGESAYRKVSDGKIKDQRLSKEDYTKYQTLFGQTTDELYDNIIKSDAYNSLDNAEKVKMLTSAQKVAKNLSDSVVGGRELEKSEQKLVDIYKEDGADGVVKYLGEKAEADALGLSHDTYVKKQAEFPGGAKAYAQAKANAKKLGLDTDTYIKQEQENPNGAQGYLQDKEDAVAFGFVDKNGKPKTEAYESARELFGDDDYAIRKSQELKANGITKAADKVPELMNDTTLTNEAKGKLLVGDAKSLSGTKKTMFDMGGYEGAYYYYLIKNLADADGNGNVKKAERAEFFEGESQYLDDLWNLNHEMYMYLMNNLK